MPVSDKDYTDALVRAEGRRLDDLRKADLEANQRAIDLLAKDKASASVNHLTIAAMIISVVAILVTVAAVILHRI